MAVAASGIIGLGAGAEAEVNAAASAGSVCGLELDVASEADGVDATRGEDGTETATEDAGNGAPDSFIFGEAETEALDVEGVVATGAGRRARSSALSSSISAFIAASSLAIAGGISGSGTPAAPEAAAGAGPELGGTGSEAAALTVPAFAAMWFSAILVDAISCDCACAAEENPTNNIRMKREISRVEMFDKRVFAGRFFSVIFVLVMEQSFPQFRNRCRGGPSEL